MKTEIEGKVLDAVGRFEEGMSQMPEWFQDLFGGTSIWDMMINNGLQVVGIGAAGWLLATWLEHRHLRDMDEREIPLKAVRANTLKHPPPCEPECTTLLIGSVVVSHDYFRTLIIFIRKLIGGNIRPYERLIHRGRREALIRMKEEAQLRGLDTIVNVRFTASIVAGKFLNAVEMVAYGTGVTTTDQALVSTDAH